MRVLIDRLTGLELPGDLDDDQLRKLYAVPRLPWMRGVSLMISYSSRPSTCPFSVTSSA